MLLNNYGKYGEFVKLDFQRYTFNQVDKKDADNVTSKGFYARYGDVEMALFIYEEKLNFIIQKTRFVLSHNLEIKNEGRGRARTLIIYQSGHKIMSVNYRTKYEMIEDDFTACVEEEHFDFGLFVKNVNEDYERQERLIRQNSPGNTEELY